MEKVFPKILSIGWTRVRNNVIPWMGFSFGWVDGMEDSLSPVKKYSDAMQSTNTISN